jgi:hypothetical protein
MEQEPETRNENIVYYFKCEGCQSEVFWSDIKPSVERAARVFKWVRAGCPNEACSGYLILSSPDRIFDRSEAKKVFEGMKEEGKQAYWI